MYAVCKKEANLIERPFAKMGACVKIAQPDARPRWGSVIPPVALDVRSLGEKVRNQAGWTRMTRNAHVYVRGAVRHPDHKTIFLNGWHEVFVNTEFRAAAMRNVAFLD